MDYMSSRLLVFAVLLLSASHISSALKLNLIHRSIDSTNPVSLHEIRENLVPSKWGTLVFVNISIGNPPSPQLLAMDTGSSPTWVQCVGCNPCFKQGGPLFDPAGSTTHKGVSCNSVYCSEGCDDGTEVCPYKVEYADKSVSEGTLGTDEFTFSTSDDGETSFGGIVFGCCYESAGNVDGGTGILGLGWRWDGLAPQLEADRFSYCIGDVTDKDYRHSHLVVGRGSRLEGSSTPLTVHGGHYYVTLQGISIGDRRLDIDDDQGVGSSHYVLVDTGASLNYLPRPASDAVRNEVKKFVGTRLSTTQVYGPDYLCYLGVAREEMVGFPVVRLHLADGVDLVLGIESLFPMYSKYPDKPGNVFCLAIQPRTEGSRLPPVIGLAAQQFYNVGYDIKSSRVYFQRIDCQYLGD